MKAIIVDKARKLVLSDVDEPKPQQSEAIVRVAAISLNRGEVRRAASAPEGFRPGWDLAGIVEIPAADGTGAKGGTRVVGLMQSGAWAEKVPVRTDMMAALPSEVSFSDASCLPVAGLTAMHAIGRRGDLIGRKVLITGASGGVGHFACQLAKLAGARVVASLRSDAHSAFVHQHGADEVAVVGSDPMQAAKLGPFDLILESVGAESFSASVRMLAPDGICVVFGASDASTSAMELQPFYILGGGTIYGLAMFHELARRERASTGLARLASLMAARKLKTHIAVEKPWTALDEVARDLLDRRYPGKAVLRLA